MAALTVASSLILEAEKSDVQHAVVKTSLLSPKDDGEVCNCAQTLYQLTDATNRRNLRSRTSCKRLFVAQRG